MSADGTQPEDEVAADRRGRALGAAFFAWGVGGLLTAQLASSPG